jgi:ATP-dependent helicase/nuclease subunit A
VVDADDFARRAALDAGRSFIVQAPAGSGKTELLIQRYLVLLATVDEPEQIVAITFTRKAAAEMRKRVRRALTAASDGTSGRHPHERRTLDLARAVAARDLARGWSLETQPQRLRIDTLDAFNVWLAQQLPLLADGTAAADIVDDASEEYQEAARRVTDALGEPNAFGGGIRTLLQSLDNNFSTLEGLLAGLLPRRDQWLARFAALPASELRVMLEGALGRLVDDHVAALAGEWPADAARELTQLLRHAAQHASDPHLRETLWPWVDSSRPPMQGREALTAWRGAAALLLTRQGQWRRKIDRQLGFGPEHATERDRLRSLLARLADNDRLRERLATVAELPEPTYSAPQWAHLEALQTVLKRLAAELKVLFAERRSIDFVELGLAARRALGASDRPSELLLALDRRIQHILVDEFQDTSQSQLQLLELLTEGWQPDDGRTLFLVGDPMQSIYRFRDADMSLFLRAKRNGIGHVQLDSLVLQRNFRSAPAVVEWVNQAFAGVFPAEDDLATGTAAFHASVCARESEAEQLVQMHALEDREAEVERVIDILATERRRAPEQSMAVLVQSRSHLNGLHERLRALGWPVHAVEIDGLDRHQVAQDLVGLTRALTHLGDRVAWLATLRAPWFGVAWADLHELCHDAREESILELMADEHRLGRLSADGRVRLLAARGKLGAAFAERGAQSLAVWVERTWQSIDGPACLDNVDEHGIVDQYFALLARLERDGDLDDPERLQTYLERAQPQSDPPRGRGIEIMTMHRAKGLEFDTVVLLGLGREPRPEDAKALYWMQRATAEAADDLVFAPLTADSDDKRLVAFVRATERQRDAAERARLLYVAATRARERLHLVCELAAGKTQPSPNTLLSLVWPAAASAFQGAHAEAVSIGTAAPITPILRRLAHVRADSSPPPQSVERSGPDESRPEYAWVGEAAAHVGSVVHRYLQRIADEGLSAWSPPRIAACAQAFALELELLGVEPGELADAAGRVGAALNAAITDKHGRWVLGSHEESRSELRLTIGRTTGLEHVRLDRTFVADGTRWIVDFKTSRHEGGDIHAFLESEVERYRAQLETYSSAMAEIDSRPIRVALYFPLLSALRVWEPAL